MKTSVLRASLLSTVFAWLTWMRSAGFLGVAYCAVVLSSWESHTAQVNACKFIACGAKCLIMHTDAFLGLAMMESGCCHDVTPGACQVGTCDASAKMCLVVQFGDYMQFTCNEQCVECEAMHWLCPWGTARFAT